MAKAMPLLTRANGRVNKPLFPYFAAPYRLSDIRGVLLMPCSHVVLSVKALGKPLWGWFEYDRPIVLRKVSTISGQRAP
jgi:hypothetical protein